MTRWTLTARRADNSLGGFPQEGGGVAFTQDFLAEATQVLARLDCAAIDRTVGHLLEAHRQGGSAYSVWGWVAAPPTRGTW